MHAQKYAGHNITRRIPLLCHFADFARTNGATDLPSASPLVEKFGDHWIAGNRCWNLETRPKLRRDICSIIRQMLRLTLDGRVTREQGRPPFLFQSEALLGEGASRAPSLYFGAPFSSFGANLVARTSCVVPAASWKRYLPTWTFCASLLASLPLRRHSAFRFLTWITHGRSRSRR
jgi:hypothetical protein